MSPLDSLPDSVLVSNRLILKISNLPLLAATTTSTLHCPPHVQQSKYLNDFGTHCYEFILYRKKNWPDAEIDCKHAGGLLVSIESEAEQNFIYQTLMVSWSSGNRQVGTRLSERPNVLKEKGKVY